MQLTKHTDYAFRSLIYLASMPDSLTTIQHIADSFNMSKSHLMKIINKLTSQGYVESVRGKNGGIRLGKPAETILLRDVIELMETTLEPLDCAGQKCVILRTCKLKGLLKEAQQRYLDFLGDYSIRDLIDEPTVKLIHFDTP